MTQNFKMNPNFPETNHIKKVYTRTINLYLLCSGKENRGEGRNPQQLLSMRNNTLCNMAMSLKLG